MTFGAWKPVVLLPQALVETLPPEELRVILGHELAHQRRWDLWLSWLQIPISAHLVVQPGLLAALPAKSAACVRTAATTSWWLRAWRRAKPTVKPYCRRRGWHPAAPSMEWRSPTLMNPIRCAGG